MSRDSRIIVDRRVFGKLDINIDGPLAERIKSRLGDDLGGLAQIFTVAGDEAHQEVVADKTDTPAPTTPTDPMLQFFAYEHLPPALQEVSKPFGETARWMVAALPRNPERTAGLRKLLEAKDCAVRARLYKDSTP